jgi:hypothetical protein
MVAKIESIMKKIIASIFFTFLIICQTKSFSQIILENSNGVTIFAHVKYLVTNYDTTQFCDYDLYKIEICVDNNNVFDIIVHYEVYNYYNFCNGALAGTNSIETSVIGEIVSAQSNSRNVYETNVRNYDGVPVLGYTWRWEMKE